MSIFKTKTKASKTTGKNIAVISEEDGLAVSGASLEESPFKDFDFSAPEGQDEVQTKPKKNRFKPESAMRLIVSMASLGDRWDITDLSDKNATSVILSSRNEIDPPRIVLSVEDGIVIMEALSYKMVMPEPEKKKFGRKAEQPVAVRTEVRKTLKASKRSELKHLEDYLMFLS